MILAWVEKHFTNYKIRKGGQEIVMPNPWGDSGSHYNVSLVEKEIKAGDGKRKGFWVHDWRPGHQGHDGSFIKLVQEYKGITFFEALKEISGVKVDPKDWLRENRNEHEEEDLPEEIELKLPDGARRIDIDDGTAARRVAFGYLSYRGITTEEVKRYFIHYDNTTVIFPYVEFGMVVYWQSREIVNKRFMFPSENIGVVKSDFLYGFDFVEPGGPLIIVESIIDSINIGFGAVAMGGAILSAKQVRKALALNPGYVILGADNDKPDAHGIKAGLSSIWANYNVLKPYFDGKIFYSVPPDPHKDWNDMKKAGLDPRQAVQDLMKPATLKSLIALRRSR